MHHKHNQLLHSENQMDEGKHAVNVSAALINQSSEVTSFLQTVPASIQSGGNRLDTNGLVDRGSMVSFIDQRVQEKLRAQGTDVTLNIAGIHGTKDLSTEKVPLKVKGLHSKVHSIEAFSHPSLSLRNANYNYNKLKQSFNHLSVLPNKKFNLMEVCIILGQEVYELPHPLDYKIGTWSEPFAVLTELGWVVIGPMTGMRRQKVCHFAFNEYVKVAENIQTWWDIETYFCEQNVVSQSKKEMQAQMMLDKVHRRAVRSGTAVEWTRTKPTEQLQLSLGSILFTGAKTLEGSKPENFLSSVNKCRCRKRIRQDIERVRCERRLRKGMVFFTPSSAK